MKKIILYFISLTLFFYIFSLKASAQLPTNPEVRKLFYLVNLDRKKNGVAPLKYNVDLEHSAMDRCNDMVKNNYFSHTSPTGLKAWDFIHRYTTYTSAAENLGTNFKSVEQLEQAWMKSPKHRAAILDEDYKEVGLAICGSRIRFSVEHFRA